MAIYRGLEKVDPDELEKQRVLTKALWKSLNEHGVQLWSEGKITAFFTGNDESSITGLTSAFSQNAAWNFEVRQLEDVPTKMCVILVSPKVRLSLAAFLELTEVMMIAAVEYSLELDGFEVAIHEVTRRPWWRFW